MLPGAPPMANPQAAFQATRTSNQDAQAKMLENRKAAYEQELQRTTQALFSQSIDPATGKPNFDTFLKLAAKTPFGAAAHTQVLSSFGGQMDAQKKGAELAVYMGGAGIEQPWSQRKPSDPVRQDTAKTPAVPEKGFAESVESMRFAPPKVGAADVDEMTPGKIASLPDEAQEELFLGLNASGIPVKKHDFIGMAKGLKTAAEADISALTKGTDPTKPMEGLAAAGTAKALAPKTALESRAKIIEAGRTAKGQRLSQEATRFGTEKAKLEQAQEQDPIQFYRNTEHIAANKGNIGEIQKLFGRRGVIENAMDHVQELKERVKKGEFKNADEFNAATSLAQQAIGYSEDANTEGGRATLFSPFRSSKSFGAVVNEAGGPIDILSRMAKNATATQTQEEYLRLLEGTLKSLRTSGVNEGNIRKLPRLSPLQQKPSAKPVGKPGGAPTSSAKTPSKPLNLDEIE